MTCTLDQPNLLLPQRIALTDWVYERASLCCQDEMAGAGSGSATLWGKLPVLRLVAHNRSSCAAAGLRVRRHFGREVQFGFFHAEAQRRDMG